MNIAAIFINKEFYATTCNRINSILVQQIFINLDNLQR